MFKNSYKWDGIDTLFFDLDGTIIDVSTRYYRLHCDLCVALGEEALPFHAFWQLKRQDSSIEQILPNALPATKESYISRWLLMIEASKYLQYDLLMPGVLKVLAELGNKYYLKLVTMRRDRRALEEELIRLAIANYFGCIICRRDSDDNRSKWQLIHDETKSIPARAIIVGDSEDDIDAGKRLGFITFAVAKGIRTEMLLQELKPDFIIQNICDLPEALIH